MIIIHIHGVMLVDMDIVIRREFKTTDLMEQCWLAIFILIMNILIYLNRILIWRMMDKPVYTWYLLKMEKVLLMPTGDVVTEDIN